MWRVDGHVQAIGTFVGPKAHIQLWLWPFITVVTVTRLPLK